MHPLPRLLRRLPPALAAALLAMIVTVWPSGAQAALPPAGPALGVWPLQPRPPVVAGFDPPATPFGRGHRGVDLAGRPGQPVHAALAGRVTYAGSLAGRGVVVVDHGSVRTTYQPLAATVQAGDHVATGAMIGRLLLAGSHCFPRACLHWGLIEGRDHYLDPLRIVGAVPVRLLPWQGGVAAPAAPGAPGGTGAFGAFGAFEAPGAAGASAAVAAPSPLGPPAPVGRVGPLGPLGLLDARGARRPAAPFQSAARAAREPSRPALGPLGVPGALGLPLPAAVAPG